jgi:hypothetical protein
VGNSTSGKNTTLKLSRAEGATTTSPITRGAPPVSAVPMNGNITTGKPNGHGNGNGKDEQLFCLALMKSALEAGKVTDLSEEQLVELVQRFRRAFARTFGHAQSCVLLGEFLVESGGFGA